MQIEAGKYYRTLEGNKAFVAHHSHDPLNGGPGRFFGFVAGTGAVDWSHAGHFYKTICASQLDLIAPWVDPPKKVALEATVHADGRVEVDLTPLGDFNTRNLQIIVPNKICEIVTFDCMPCCDTPYCGK